MAKIDYHFGPFHRGLDRVPEIALRDHVDLRIILSKVDNRLSHSADSADFTSPDSKVRTRLQTSTGNKFDATLTTPTAPTDMKGSVNESSPLKIVNASGRRLRNSLMRSTLPLASLTDTMFRHSVARRTSVSGPMSTPQRPGIL